VSKTPGDPLLTNQWDLVGTETTEPGLVGRGQLGRPLRHRRRPLHRRPAADARRASSKSLLRADRRRNQPAAGQVQPQQLRRHPQPGADRRLTQGAEHLLNLLPASAARIGHRPAEYILKNASWRKAEINWAPRAKPKATFWRTSSMRWPIWSLAPRSRPTGLTAARIGNTWWDTGEHHHRATTTYGGRDALLCQAESRSPTARSMRPSPASSP
jgi:hypothetical protein